MRLLGLGRLSDLRLRLRSRGAGLAFARSLLLLLRRLTLRRRRLLLLGLRTRRLSLLWLLRLGPRLRSGLKRRFLAWRFLTGRRF